jgi:hypothetical protein
MIAGPATWQRMNRSLRAARCTPVWALWRPALAARLWTRAPLGTVVATYCVQLVLFGGVLAGLIAWHDALDVGYGQNGIEWARYRSAREIWDIWWWQGQLQIISIVTFAVVGPAVLLWAWLQLPLVHRTGSGWRSYARASRALALYLSPVTLLTLAIGALTVRVLHAGMLRAMNARPFVTEAILPITYGGGTLLLLLWFRAARRGALAKEQLPALPPRCETCGYDLTHQPAEARCPECGEALAASLDPQTRPDAGWSRGRGVRSWIASTLAVLFRPAAFYRALQVRGPQTRAHRFAVWHSVLLYPAAAAGLLLILHTAEPSALLRGEEWLYFGGAILWGTIGCWFGARIIGAVVVTWWLARGALPDYQWAVHVIRYESAFLWAFCTFWGLLLLSFAHYENWISRLLLANPSIVPVGEIASVVGGTALLAVGWCWRYAVALRAIRWANY